MDIPNQASANIAFSGTKTNTLVQNNAQNKQVSAAQPLSETASQSTLTAGKALELSQEIGLFFQSNTEFPLVQDNAFRA